VILKCGVVVMVYSPSRSTEEMKNLNYSVLYSSVWMKKSSRLPRDCMQRRCW
jgi:hypothetical protein